MKKFDVFAMVIFKNVLMPSAALLITYGFWRGNLFGDDLVMKHVIYISFCSPTALVIMVMTQIQDYANKKKVWLMLWIYIFSRPILIISTYLFFLFFELI